MSKNRIANPEQGGALVRTLIQFAAGYAVSKGWADAEAATVIGAGLVSALTLAYGWWVRRDGGLVQSAAGVPAVLKIVAPGVSAAHDEAYPKVRSAG